MSGNPDVFFLTRLVPSSRSHRSSTRCRRTWYDDRHSLTSIARCPRSWLLSPYNFLRPLPFFLLSLVSSGSLHLEIPLSSKVTSRLGPLPLVLRLPMVTDALVSMFHRRGGHARTVPRRRTVTHIRYFGVSGARPVLPRSGCSTRLDVLLLVSNFAPSSGLAPCVSLSSYVWHLVSRFLCIGPSFSCPDVFSRSLYSLDG